MYRRAFLAGVSLLALVVGADAANFVGPRRALLSGGVPSWVFPGAAPDLNFAAGQYYGGTLATLIHTSRTSNGYATNSDGTMTLFGVNTPRIGVGTGLLVEEARTNILVHSNDWTTDWTVDFLTFTKNTIAPDGTVSAWTVNNGLTNNLHRFYQIFAADAGTRSFYAKAGTASFVSIASDSGIGAVFDLSLGTISSSAGGTATITPSAFGFYRISFTPTVAGTSVQMTLAMGETAGQAAIGGTSYQATGKTIIICFAQFETGGAFPTSYIPTAGATVTRAADVVSLIGAAQTALQGAAWSYVLSLGPMSRVDIGSRLIGDSGNVFVLYIFDVTTIHAFAGGNSVTSNNILTLSNKIAQAQSGTTQSMVANGGTVDTSAVLDGAATISYLGSDNGASPYPNGYFKRLSLWTSCLPDATLRALST